MVIVFVTVDCPIANAYAPELAALHERYADAGVAFRMVHVDPTVDASAAQEHARSFGLPGEILLDPHHELARALGAEVTPEAFVFDRGGTLVYRGRIDDSFWRPGRRRPRATTHELAEALRAVTNGDPVPVPRTQAVGCRLPLLEP